MYAKSFILLNVCIFSYAFSAPFQLFHSPFRHWYCVDIAKNIDKSKPYVFCVGELPLVAWFNDTQPISTLNICKSDKGTDAFGNTMIYEDKLWWTYDPYNKLPPATPYYKHKDYNTIMFTMDMDANIQNCILNTLDMKHYDNIHSHLFGKKMYPMQYKIKKYNQDKLSIHNSKTFILFQYPYTSNAILSLNKKERLIITINMLPLSPNKTRWIITMKHNFWKSFFAKVKMDFTLKFILQQDKEQMSKQASDTMMKTKVLANNQHKELAKMFRSCEYPDMISAMRLCNYHNREKK